MTSTSQSRQKSDRSQVWLRGLLAIAWADGNFDETERQLIAELTHGKSDAADRAADLEPISPEELAATLGDDPDIAENFLRTAVMVAIADGVYTKTEDKVLHDFCEALGLRPDALDALRHTLEEPEDLDDIESKDKSDDASSGAVSLDRKPKDSAKINVLAPVRNWLDNVELHDPKVARFLCRMIPSQCPFERDVTLFGKKVVHIPAMCKLNPLYEQLVGLRFRALSYLADEKGEDVTAYL
ncbi:Mo-dependent nitrogenase C-terminal domain-containing protein [Baaleninema simplex]|uniref:Mo-dependent nitrogenase C-terminal domain-containing protein n=1 Tax=Baaleninema simplex TaxID=2862350 RepID=UPI000347CE21|nr:Mo-dependent nitrogenase C-terminal domain-containing protein [Baaleninema simplex]